MKQLVQLKNKENENLDPINLNYEKRIKTLEDNVYSMNEVDTGKKWIDGNSIYRKVINVDSLPNTTRLEIVLNIDYDSIINVRGIANNGTTFIPIPWSDENGTSNVMKCFVQNNNLNIDTGSDRTNYSAFFVLEYTKTTD